MRVVVLVPRRADNGRRDHIWNWLADRWATEHPDWLVYEGHHDDGPFNRAAAINTAARNAGEWDVAVIADADTFVGPDQIDRAVELADRGAFTLAYDRFSYLSARGTDLVMSGWRGCWEDHIEWSLTGTCSSMLAVRRDLFDRVGGFDEGFVGWGSEDVGFSNACTTFAPAGIKRVPGTAWHLAHPVSHENNRHDPQYWANVERGKRYGPVLLDQEGMAALLAELGVTK